MIFNRALDGILGRRSNVALLRFLVRTRGEHSGRDLARFLDLDHKTCHASLRDLAEQGVVSGRRLGTALTYRLRDGHPVVADILVPAFEREAQLAERYVREAKEISGAPALSVVLFGSVARGEEEARSDVDILFVTRDRKSRERAKADLAGAAGDLAARYGSAAQFVVEDLDSFRRQVARGNPLHEAILRTGRVVWGKPLSELLRHGGKEGRHPKRPAG